MKKLLLALLLAPLGLLAQPSGGNVNRIVAGSGVSVSPTQGTGVVTISASGSGVVTSITGTAGQVTASAATGAVTLSLPTALTGINSITSVAGQALTLANGTGGTAVTFANATNAATFSPVARTSGVASYFTVTPPADTGITAATESIGVNFPAVTRTWADGTVALQEEHFIGSPTYNKTTTSATFTLPATLSVGAPVAGTGVTITNPAAILVRGTGQTIYGVTALAKIGVSLDATSADLAFTGTATGNFTFNSAGSVKIIKSTSDNQLILDVATGQRYTSLTFANNTTTKGQVFWDNSSNTLGIQPNNTGATTSIYSGSGVLSLTIGNGGDAQLIGGAGNMTLRAGTGNSRTMTFQTTTSGGTATTGFVMDITQGITLASLAGTGSRAVLADANGLLSAPVSDETWKENMRALPDSMGLATVMALRPLIYNYKDRSRFGNQEYIGFGARETSTILPQVTGQDRDGVYYMNKEDLTASLVKGMQQQQAEIEALKAELAGMRN